MRKKVLIADDHQLIVDGLVRILESAYEVVTPVLDGRALLRSVAELQPDVVVADISMPLLNGLDAAAELTASHPNVKVIIVTMHADVSFAARAFDAGAAGYLLKQSASSELKTAIETVLRGETYIPPAMADKLLKTYRGAAKVKEPERTELTRRQREVLQLLAEGKSAGEAAEVLHLSRRTVEFHKYRIMELLGIKTNAGLVRHAIDIGLIQGDSSEAASAN
jgi:DNA-binding NarL/FixJ family response regulator